MADYATSITASDHPAVSTSTRGSTDRPTDYDSLSKLLHWSVALSMFGLLAFGFFLESLPSGKEKVPLIQIHKSVGVLVAFLLLLRLGRRLILGFLPADDTESRPQRLVARSIHVLLLLLPIGMVVSGVLRSLAYGRSIKVFGLDFIPKLMEKNEALHAAASNAHVVFAWALVACIALHAGAALWHHYVSRDGTLRRMLPGVDNRLKRGEGSHL